MADLRKPIADQRRIRDDLEGIVRGDVLFDDITRTLYSTDASLFEVRPLGVGAPRDEEDVCALVRYAAHHEVPLLPRGAGTGGAGGGPGRKARRCARGGRPALGTSPHPSPRCWSRMPP